MSSIKLLGEVARIVPGFAFGESFQGRSDLLIPFIKVSDFAAGNDSWLSTAANMVDGQLLKLLRARTYPTGTIVFPKVGGALLTNKRARLKVEATFDNNVMGLVPTAIDADYLFYFMRSFDMRTLANTQSLPSVRASDVARIELPVPSPDEQRRIAAHLKSQLASVEEARQAAQAQLADVQRLAPAILDAAFAETTDAEPVRIGDVARTTSGTTPSRSRKDFWEPAKYPWVKTGEVAFAPISSTEERISETALAECSLSLLPPATVLIAMYGQGKTRGQSAVLEVEAATNQACFAILPNETFDPEYLQFWLRHSYQNLRAQSEARGGNQSNLNGEMLSGFEVPLVPRDRQEDIAKKIKAGLAEADRVRQAIEAQLQEIELLPSRLLAQVFGTSA